MKESDDMTNAAKINLSDIIYGWDFRTPVNPVIVKNGDHYEIASGLTATGDTLDIAIVEAWAGVNLGEDIELDRASADALVEMLND